MTKSKQWKEKDIKEKPLNMGNIMGDRSVNHSLTGDMSEGLVHSKRSEGRTDHAKRSK